VADRSRHTNLRAVASRARAGRLRTLRWLAAPAALAAALVLLACAASGGKRSSWPFGSFAGYAWRGRVASVQASWTVPRIIRGSSPGVAGTWIGAQAPGKPEPSIQIGTNEESFPPAQATAPDNYFAFWADVRRHFRPQRLFPVSPGDNLTASLMLIHRRWTLAIVDATSGAAARFSTREEAQGSFNLAEWTQEDVTDEATRKPYPYPQMTPVVFRGLAVNSTTPSYADLYSLWMSTDGTYLAPSALHHDSFTLRRATVSPSGAQYLRIATGADVATVTFTSRMSLWTAATTRAQIASACSSFATALRDSIHAFRRARWPTRVRGLVDLLVRDSQAVLDDTLSAVPVSAAGLAAWRSRWARDAAGIGSAAHLAKRALGLPEIRPVP
jgi:hypothetical protein